MHDIRQEIRRLRQHGLPWDSILILMEQEVTAARDEAALPELKEGRTYFLAEPGNALDRTTVTLMHRLPNFNRVVVRHEGETEIVRPSSLLPLPPETENGENHAD